MKKIISVILTIAMMLNICANFAFAESQSDEAWKQYAVFSGSDTDNVSMSCWRSTINGGVYTGSNFIYNGSELYLNGTCSAVGSIITNGWLMNIQKRQPNSVKVDMPMFGNKIKENAINSAETVSTQQSFSANEINLSEPIISDAGITFDGTRFSGEGYIIAKDDITYNVSWLDTGDDYYSVIYSENGDITINGSSITINGILYAPNGRIQFNVSTLNLNGRIIADSVVFSGSQFNITGTDGDWDWIDGGSQSPVSKTYTLSSDFEEGAANNVNITNDELNLSATEETEISAFEKEYTNTNVSTGINAVMKYDKSNLTLGKNSLNVNFELNGFGQVDSVENAVDIVILIDKSGSMEGSRFTNAIAGARDVIDYMRASDRCAIVAFSGSADVYCEWETDKEVLNNALDEIPVVFQGTSIYAGLKKSLLLFDDSQDREKVIFLLSDGEDSNRQKVIDEAEKAKNNDVTIYTIGVGKTVDRALLEDIAISSQGIYKYTETGDGIGDLMNYMASEVFNVAARQVKVQGRIPADIAVNSIVPIPDEIISNDDGSQTIKWLLDKLLMDESQTISLNTNIKTEEISWKEIMTDLCMVYYDKDGNPQVTYFDDIILPVTDIASEGSWETVYDSQKNNTSWKNIYWNGSIVNDSSIEVYAAVSDDNVTFSEFVPVRNNALLQGLQGRYIKVKTVLKASSDGKSPTLYDITVLDENCDNVVLENNAPTAQLQEEITTRINKYTQIIPTINDLGFITKPLSFKWTCEDQTVLIKDPDSFMTGAVFAETGEYELKLTVSDGENTIESTIMVVVEENDDYGTIAPEQEQELSLSIELPDGGVEQNSDNVIKFIPTGGTGTVWLSVKLNGAYINLNSDNEYIYNPDEVCTFTIDAYAYDTSGNSAYSGGKYRTNGEDITKPEVSIEVSAEEVILSEAITVTTIANDSVGVADCAVKINGEEMSLDENGECVYTPKEIGTYVIEATAKDEAGNITTVTKEFEVVKDYTAPVPKITLSKKTAAVGEQVTVTVSATDNIAVTSIELLVNGNKVELDSNNKYYYIGDTKGTIEFTVNAYDAENNNGTKTATLTVTNDSTPPTVRISSSSSFVAGLSLTATLTASDNVAVTSTKLFAGDVEVLPNEDGKYTIASEEAGTIVLTAYAYDEEGNEGTYTKTITVKPDTTAPTVSMSSYSSVVAGKSITVKVKASDNVGVTKLEVVADGETVTLDRNNEFVFAPTEAKTAVITATAYDKAGNSTTATKNITVKADETNPSVTLSVNRTTAYLNQDVKITSYASDNVGVTKFTVDINGEPIVMNEDNTYIFTPTVGGTYVITATAYDAAGNTTTKQKTVTAKADTTKPTISTTVKPSSTVCIGQFVTITFKASDAVGVTKFEVLRDGEKIELTDNTYTFEAEAEGNVVFTSTAEDLAGNVATNTRTINVTKDTKAPTVTLTTSADTINRGETVTATIQATDNVAVDKVELYYNDELIDVDESGVAVYTPNCSGTFTAKVYDEAGNVGTAEKTLIVKSATSNPDIPDSGEDYVKPEITITSDYIGEGTIYIPTETDVRVYVAFEDNVGVVSSEVWLDDEQVTLDEQNSFVFNSGNAGVYIVKATAADVAGNVGYAEKEFFAITGTSSAASEIAITSPSDGEEVKGEIHITGTVKDDDLVKYELAYSESGKDEYVVFAEGKEIVENDVIGTLDTTLLNNGIYDIRLAAYDASGGSVNTVVSYIVSGALKLGNFSIGFDDMTIPVNGLPLTVTRTYDSRSRNTVGDFGYGWDMTLSNIKIEVTTSVGSNWYQISDEVELTPTYMINEYRPHKIIVTYPNGEADSFKVVPNPQRKTITPILDATLTLVAEDGTHSTLEFADNEEITFVQIGTDVQFCNSSGTDVYNPKKYKLTTKEGVEYLLDVDNGVEKITNTDGTTLTFTDSGITHSDGRSILFERDGQKRITSITDPMGNSVKYGYDNCGDLVAVADQMDNVVRFTYDENHYLTDIISADGVRVGRNEYDDSGRLIATIDADGNRIEYTHNTDDKCEIVKDRLGNQTVYYYDEDGNVTKTVDAYGNETAYTYDEDGNKLTETNTIGDVISYTYNSDGKMTSFTDAIGAVTTMNYDEYGQLVSISDVENNLLIFDYDDFGNITKTTDEIGNENEYNYDNKHRPESVADKIGTKMSFTYDENGNIVTMTDANGTVSAFTYDENGRRTSRTITRTSDNGTETFTDVYGYDKIGNITSIKHSDGTVTRTEYNELNKISAEIEADGSRKEYHYDNFGNMVAIIYPDGTSESFDYDLEGNNISATDRLGRKRTFTYDKLGRLVKTEYPNGSFEVNVYDSEGRVTKKIAPNGGETSYEYNAVGRTTQITDALGGVVKYEYNSLSQLVKSTDANGNSYVFEYDAGSNCISTTYPDGTKFTTEYDDRSRITATTDQNGNITKYQYNNGDDLISVTDSMGNKYSYTYDSQGNLIGVIDANGNKTSYEYDEFSRVVKTILPLGMSSENVYNSNGKVISYTDFMGNVTKYSYDAMGRVDEKIFYDGTTVNYSYNNDGTVKSVADKNGVTVYTYNDMGMLTHKTLPTGDYILYEYDLACNITKITTPYSDMSYEYDKLNRITRIIDKDGNITLYEYDANGNRKTVHHANGMIISYNYDSLNRLICETVKSSEGITVAEYKYTLDNAGNRIRAEEFSRTVSYEYDTLGRLIKETTIDNGISHVIEYTYDNVSNRLSKTENGKTTTYVYDANNRLISRGTEIFEYDNNGNLISQIGDDKTSVYTYNAENWLIFASVETKNSINTEAYEYDFEGTRIGKTINGAETINYICDTNNVLSRVLVETDGGGNVKTVYTYGDELLSLSRENEYRIYLFDGHGNARMLADENQTITDTYDYDAYGNLTNCTGETENNYLYCGEQYDEITGYYYLRARYMNPEIGRFITMDTYQGTTNDPVSLHKYLYANANPVMYIDPTGNFSLGEINITQGIRNSISSAYSAMNKLYFKALNFVKNHAELFENVGKSIINGIVTGMTYESTGKRFGAGFINGFISGLGSEFAGRTKNNYKILIFSQISSALGSLTEDLIYNKDKSGEEIIKDMGKSAAISIIGSVSTMGIEYAITMANLENSVAKQLMVYDERFGKALTIFFEQVINSLTSMGG